jgi:glucosamine-6-phosphate deaminase
VIKSNIEDCTKVAAVPAGAMICVTGRITPIIYDIRNRPARITWRQMTGSPRNKQEVSQLECIIMAVSDFVAGGQPTKVAASPGNGEEHFFPNIARSVCHTEKVPVTIFKHAGEASQAVAHEIAQLIQQRSSAGKKCILGLATGSTPLGVYKELVRMHHKEALSFQSVITFNLDEYYGISHQASQSYHRFMWENLFSHIDILKENVHIPDGELPPEQVAAYCQSYDQQIRDAGGLDLQLLGIGRTGHIGFNEPGSPADSRTRLIALDRVTRLDAASDFYGQQHVPLRAITMGVGTIMESRRIILMAFGENKSATVAQAVEGPISANLPASYLQQHSDVQFVLDSAAAAHLTRVKTPWLTGPVQWNPEMTKRGVIWLAQKLNKAILKLTDEDFGEHGLQDLLAGQGPAYDINLGVFRELVGKITGWPAGKPESLHRPGDIRRPGDAIFPKKILVFSPHPDDDVISMGGTIIRMVDQGHEVHIAYQTSGNIAVFDADALRYADFVREFNRGFGLDAASVERLERQVEEFVVGKKAGDSDSPPLRTIKTLIRRCEARAGARACGIPSQQLHFLELPFYETGLIRKDPISSADVDIIVKLLRDVQPHQIYAAGDLSDPHGTHRMCLEALVQAIDVLYGPGAKEAPEVWLYRGAWQEWEPESIDMAIPLSPGELARKRDAIFKHQSQKDRAMFPGTDQREFWQRAEDRNRGTADIFNRLGLAEYEAIEGFVKWIAHHK